MIQIQAQIFWAWTGIIFDWMILSRILVFWDHSQQPMIVYEVSWLNFDNVRLYHAYYVPYYLWRKSRNTGSIPFEPEPGSGSFAEILGQYQYLKYSVTKWDLKRIFKVFLWFNSFQYNLISESAKEEEDEQFDMDIWIYFQIIYQCAKWNAEECSFFNKSKSSYTKWKKKFYSRKMHKNRITSLHDSKVVVSDLTKKSYIKLYLFAKKYYFYCNKNVSKWIPSFLMCNAMKYILQLPLNLEKKSFAYGFWPPHSV